jgi:hypothetical protein
VDEAAKEFGLKKSQYASHNGKESGNGKQPFTRLPLPQEASFKQHASKPEGGKRPEGFLKFAFDS